MLNHPTADRLRELNLLGMLAAWHEQQDMRDIARLSFEERFGLILDREVTTRANRRLATRLKRAKLRQDATLEDIDYSALARPGQVLAPLPGQLPVGPRTAQLPHHRPHGLG